MPAVLNGTGLVSRRVVTHHHQRSDFDLLLTDVQTPFQTLTQTPADVLCHLGSPFASNKDKHGTQSYTQAAESTWKPFALPNDGT